MQPEGPQALTVTRYLVKGVRPDSTPVEGLAFGGGADIESKSDAKALQTIENMYLFLLTEAVKASPPQKKNQ